MQDQLTSNQSTLQQPRSDLQQSTPNLQQSGSPTSSASTTAINQTPSAPTELRVETQQGQGSIDPPVEAGIQGTPNPGGLLLLLIPLVILATIFWPRKDKFVEEVESSISPAPSQPKAPRHKTKKKSAKHKKSNKR